MFAIGLIVGGAGGVLLSIASIVGLGGSSGVSANRIFLGLIGLVVLLIGIILSTTGGRRQIISVHTKLTASPTWCIQPANIVLLAMWFGLVTGLVEVAIWFVRKIVLRIIDPTFPYSSDLVWMAPLTNLIIFSILGLALFLLQSRWNRLLSLPIVVFVFIFLGSFGALYFAAPWLDLYARVILTFALAYQLTTIIANRPERFYKFVQLTFGWLPFFKKGQTQPSTPAILADEALPTRRQFLLSTGVTLAGLAVGTHSWRQIIENNALTQLPPVSKKLPNVLLIVLDTVRAQNVSAYGYSRRTTPNLERFAKTGVSFQRAISTAPWTLPSHASIFTGYWHHQLSIDWNKPLDTTHPTLAQVLSDQGYLTAGFVANLDFLCKPYGLVRGFTHYEDFPVSVGQAILSSSLGRMVTNTSQVRDVIGYHDVLNRKPANQITEDFLRWLPQESTRPFFAFLNYYDAHQPYLPPAPFDSQFGPKRSGAEFVYFTNDAERAEMWTLSPAQVQEELDAYDGTIAYMDNSLGTLFDELARRGKLENTLVIVTSDHGEQFGENGLFGHTNSLYMPTLHVPLFLTFASRVPANVNVAEPVSLRDIPATIMDLIGIGTESIFPGSSLQRFWDNNQPTSEFLLSEITGGGFSWLSSYPITKGDMKSLVKDNYHYIRRGDGNEELYGWVNDPAETRNLANSSEGLQRLESFRNSLSSLLNG